MPNKLIVSNFALLFFFFIIITAWEKINPRRVRKVLYAKRLVANFGQKLIYTFLAILMAKLVSFSFPQIFHPLFKLNLIGSFILLDLLIYAWHKLNHQVRFFWKFHRVHHLDREMDSTTALRFHFGELIFSSFYRFLILLFFEIQIDCLVLFDTVVTMAAIFHHGNIKLPFKIEKALNLLIVTPRMHEIHHSVKHIEFNSNYSVIFSIWDVIFRTKTNIIEESNLVFGQTKNGLLEQDDLLFSIKAPFSHLAMTKE